MINILTLSSVALATLRLAVTPASAHGYVSEPPSRQALCRMGQVPDCGEVEYEPHSVEAPQSSFSCNGDGARFPELNDEALWQNHFFTVPPGIESLPFTWTLTAPHRTATWEYIVITQGNAVLTSINDFNATPPAIVTHQVPLNGYTGRQTVLARWNIGDTTNAFYSCVDLLIPTGRKTAVAGAAAGWHTSCDAGARVGNDDKWLRLGRRWYQGQYASEKHLRRPRRHVLSSQCCTQRHHHLHEI